MNREIVQKLVDVVGEVCELRRIAYYLGGPDHELEKRLDDAYDAAKAMLGETGT